MNEQIVWSDREGVSQLMVWPFHQDEVELLTWLEGPDSNQLQKLRWNNTTVSMLHYKGHRLLVHVFILPSGKRWDAVNGWTQ